MGCEQFLQADSDQSGTLDKDEFTRLMTTPLMKSQMDLYGFVLDEKDLGRIWDTFDIDESENITIEELVAGFSYLQEGLATKHIANVNYSLKRVDAMMGTALQGFEETTKIFDQQ